MSRYFAVKQDDGRGWLVLRLDEIGGSYGTVVDCNMPEEAAHDLLADLRASEVLDHEYPIELVDADIRAAGGDPDSIGKRGLATVAAALAKRRERSS